MFYRKKTMDYARIAISFDFFLAARMPGIWIVIFLQTYFSLNSKSCWWQWSLYIVLNVTICLSIQMLFASTFNWLVLHLLPYLNVVDDQWCNVYTCSLLKKYAAVIISEKNIAIKIYIGLKFTFTIKNIFFPVYNKWQLDLKIS